MDCNSLCVLIPTSVLALLVVWLFLKKLLPKPKVDDFKNKFVLITGCDSGFGKMTAIRLDKMGFRVIATCLTLKGVENLIEEAGSDRLIAMVMDVTNSEQIKDVYAEIKHLVAEKGTADLNIRVFHIIILFIDPLYICKLKISRLKTRTACCKTQLSFKDYT